MNWEGNIISEFGGYRDLYGGIMSAWRGVQCMGDILEILNALTISLPVH